MERVLMSCGCRQVTEEAAKARCNTHPESFPYRRSPIGGGKVTAWDGESWQPSNKKVYGEVQAPMPWVLLTFEGGGSSKYWSILAYDYYGNGTGTSYVVHYGRIGAKGQHRWKTFSSRNEMEAAVTKVIGQKLNKGYVWKTSGQKLKKGRETDPPSLAKFGGIPSGEAIHPPGWPVGPGWTLIEKPPGGKPLIAVTENLVETFVQLRADAEAAGVTVDLVDAAFQSALDHALGHFGDEALTHDDEKGEEIVYCDDCGGLVLPDEVRCVQKGSFWEVTVCENCAVAVEENPEPPAPPPPPTAPIAAGRFQTLELDGEDDD